MATQNLSNFAYGEIALSQTVLIDDVPHMTRQAIGEWLEYADPQKAIDKILERNPHIEAHGIPVKLTGMVAQRDYETIVYHPIGFLLIVMESGQPKAKDKKVEVAEFVWHFSNPGTERLSPKDKRIIHARVSTLTLQMSKTFDAMVLSQLWREMKGLCDKIGLEYPSLELLGKDCRQISIPGFDVPKLN